MQDSFSQINWIDIFIVLIIIRCFFIGIKKGVAVELFKLLGVIASIFFTLHLYSKIASLLKNYLHLAGPRATVFANTDTFDLISFLLLAISINLLFSLVRNFFLLIFKLQATNSLEKILSGIMGFCRGIFLASLILAFFILTNILYLQKSITRSFMGGSVLALSTNTYNFINEKIAKKILPQEKNS